MKLSLPLPSPFAELLPWLDRMTSTFALTELALAAAVLLLALTRPRLGSRAFEWIERHGAALAEQPVRAVLAVGLLAIGARAALLPWLGVPAPVVHDEQSLMLQASTYLAGRLANPPHPFWEHFETFHVNQLPTYASMYFPGRGAPLALGLLVAGNAWVGVWLSFVAMCMAAVWMLQAWVSRPLALLGGVLLVLRFGVFSYWVNSYWGGAFTALGAIAVIGALPRLLREPRWGTGLVLGGGAAILMTTRAYEGLLLCIPVAVVMLVHLARGPWARSQAIALRAVLPALALVMAGGGLLLVHNAATTGDPLKTPYSLNRVTYSSAPAFLTSAPFVSENRGPAYFRDFYRAEATNYERRSSPLKVAGSVAAKVYYTWNFYIGPVFSIAFLAGLWAVRRRAFLLATPVVFLAGYSLETWNFPHYTAPILPVLLIILMHGFGALRGWRWRGREAGLFLTRAMPAAAAAVLLLPLATTWFGVPRLVPNLSSQACCAVGHDDVRTQVTRRLRAEPGTDLVLIPSGAHNPIHYEMVYNEADIDRAEIVFARRLDPDKDARLIAHFSGRRLWEFEWRSDQPGGYTLTPVAAEPPQTRH